MGFRAWSFLSSSWHYASGAELVFVAAGLFDFAFDDDGFFSGRTGASSVFDIIEMLKHILSFRFVVAYTNAVWLGQKRAHAVSASASNAEENTVLGGDSAEVVNAWA